MAEKKKEEKTKKTATKKAVSLPKTKAKVLVKEDTYPAIEIAELLGMSQFAFYIMKKEANIDDGSFLTISEFQELKKQTIGR